MAKAFISCAAAVLAAFSGCSKPQTPPPAEAQKSPAQPAPAVSPNEPTIDACSLLTSEEIQGVQGEAESERKPTPRSGGDLSVSQCFFTLPTFSKSISLQVVQRGTGKQAREPRQVWEETFHKPQPTPARELEKKVEPPVKVDGLGDEAFWLGNRNLTALYVLKGDLYIRVSVGGPDDVPTKMKKSTDLAQMIMKRL
ncbi:MAG: hypothetical protein ABR589_05680 [Chthoniobacterales bacterium]